MNCPCKILFFEGDLTAILEDLEGAYSVPEIYFRPTDTDLNEMSTKNVCPNRSKEIAV